MPTIEEIRERVNKPPSNEAWKDARKGFLASYAGGHHDDGMLPAFQHGMNTVFNVLDSCYSPPEICRTAHKDLSWAIELLVTTRAILNELRDCGGTVMAVQHSDGNRVNKQVIAVPEDLCIRMSELLKVLNNGSEPTDDEARKT